VAAAISDAVAAAELPALALTRADAAGTWRPAPPGAGGRPGTYASTLPFGLAQVAGLDPVAIAALLAARLRPVSWIEGASVTGNGYLTVAVSPQALAGLAVRVALAGDACARSTALRGLTQSAPDDTGLARAASWAQAWHLVHGAVTGRLAAAAGAQVNFTTSAERYPPPSPAAPASPIRGVGAASPLAGERGAASRAGEAGDRAGPVRGAGAASPPAGEGGPALAGGVPTLAAAAGAVTAGREPAGAAAAAVAFAGGDAIRYALARGRAGGARAIDARLSVRHVLGNPYFAVGYGHADAASVLRWAAELGLELGPAAAADPGPLDQAAELALLQAISWLPERVAGAARRGRPDEFARYLEHLAGTYLSCRENCPALPFMGKRAPGDPGAIRARLWLTAAAAAALSAGLRLLGVAAPDRM
jgi:hypothetical protein